MSVIFINGMIGMYNGAIHRSCNSFRHGEREKLRLSVDDIRFPVDQLLQAAFPKTYGGSGTIAEFSGADGTDSHNIVPAFSVQILRGAKNLHLMSPTAKLGLQISN